VGSQHQAPLAAFVLVTLMASGVVAALHDGAVRPTARGEGITQVPLQVAPSPAREVPTSVPTTLGTGEDRPAGPSGMSEPARPPGTGSRAVTSVGAALPGYASLLQRLDQEAPAPEYGPEPAAGGTGSGAAGEQAAGQGHGAPSSDPRADPPSDPPPGPPSAPTSTAPTDPASGTPSAPPTAPSPPPSGESATPSGTATPSGAGSVATSPADPSSAPTPQVP
jgi:hypothetical protein